MSTDDTQSKILGILDSLTPDELSRLHRLVVPYLQNADWPRLIEGTDEDGDPYWQCPRCMSISYPTEAVYVVDVAERWTTPCDYDGRTLRFDYDGYGEYEGLFYACQVCDEPVSLPDGVTEG